MSKQTVWVKLWQWPDGEIRGVIVRDEHDHSRSAPVGSIDAGIYRLEVDLPERKMKKKISRWVLIGPMGCSNWSFPEKCQAEEALIVSCVNDEYQIVELTGEYEE